MVDTLANALSSIKMAEVRGKPSAKTNASKLVGKVLELLQNQGYVKEYANSEEGKILGYSVILNGSINNCGVVRPRFSVKVNQWEKYEERFLPARGIGMLIVSTPQGILTHAQAKEKHTGGRLLAFVY